MNVLIGQEAPYPSWRELSASQADSQGPCMANTGRALGYTCTYSFQQVQAPPPPRTPIDCGLSGSEVAMAEDELAPVPQEELRPASGSWAGQG